MLWTRLPIGLTAQPRTHSGKHREPGGNVQALTEPDGFPLWLSEVEPGSTHDITAARAHVLGALYWTYSQLDLPTLGTGRWRAPRHLTASPRKIGDITKAALVLTHFEHGRLT